jgi:hypothetical protein
MRIHAIGNARCRFHARKSDMVVYNVLPEYLFHDAFVDTDSLIIVGVA